MARSGERHGPIEERACLANVTAVEGVVVAVKARRNFVGVFGREIQRGYGQEPQDIATFPLLEGLVLFLILRWLYRKNLYRGAVFWALIGFYGLFRFLVEFVRNHEQDLVLGEPDAQPAADQGLGDGAGLGGLLALVADKAVVFHGASFDEVGVAAKSHL